VGLVFKVKPTPRKERKDFAMRMIHRSSLTLGLAALAFGVAQAQGSWGLECIDPANTTPFSADYQGRGAVLTDLIGINYGISGTATYGGDSTMGAPCFDPARTYDAAGRFAFGVPGAGSAQSGFDDGMAYSMGWFGEPVGDFTYAMITGPGGADPELFCKDGVQTTYTGASNRYAVIIAQQDLGEVQLEMRVLADAVRMKWNFIDTNAVGGFGLTFVLSPWMRIGAPDYQGFNQANTGIGSLSGRPKETPVGGYIGFVAFDDGRPIRTEKKREQIDPNFPKYVRALWGQTDAYGLQLDTQANPSTPDASTVDTIKVGEWAFTAEGNTATIPLFGDSTGTVDDNDILISNMSILQRFASVQTGSNGTAQIIQYVRSAWSVGSYNDPYTTILDAPRTVNYDGPAAGGGSTPNPMTIRLWIDNQYATIDKEVALNNVSAQINLPAGLSLASGEPQTKTITKIQPNEISSLEWSVVSDGETFGNLPVTVTMNTVPGPTKTLTRVIRVSAAPVMSLEAGPNMLAFPYQFGDSSFDGILGLSTGTDYVAYQWDPTLRAYVPTTSAQRGIGYWVIPNAAQPSLQLQNADVSPDAGEGGLLVSLQPGWNLIGNPYNYAVPIRQLIGVAEDNNTNSMTWSQLVQNDFVSSTLTYFVPNASLPGGGSYALQPDDGEIKPHLAYWLFVKASKPVRLVWPPLFEETLPNSGRSVDSFAQNDREWRLQLSARSTFGVDSNNFIGSVSDRNRAKKLQVMKAPEAPGSKLELAILDDVDGAPTRMAQAIANRGGRQEYKVQVNAKEAGDVTVTWPNLASLPRNLRVKMTDNTSGEKRDLRASSGYTFRVDQPGTREFTVTVEQAGSARPVIGNVIVSSDSRDVRNSPITINYSLSADALVTVRVLSSTGKEVFTVTRSRSDNAGDNSATWTLRDNANRAVAPGTYKVEILAETPNGERVRKIVPVNVIR
jgi:hypothetical protein